MRNNKSFDGFAEAIGELPKQRKLDYKIMEEVDKGEYVQNKIIYKNESGEDIPAFYLVPKNAEDVPAIICLHQHANEYHLGKSEVIGLKGSPEQGYGIDLVKKGYAILAPDSVCFEEREDQELGGHSGEKYVAMKEIMNGGSLARRMITDIIYGVDFLESRGEIDKNNIALMGFSLGAMQTWMTYGFDERFRTGISICGVSSYESMFKSKIIHSSFHLYVPGLMKHTDIPEILAGFSPRSFLVLSGRKDPLYPAEGIITAVETAKQDYTDDSADERFHYRLFDCGHQLTKGMKEEAFSWLEKQLI
ncbi:MAG: prolyl oligopeptidase family serine peptidase [Candidatus Woesearchaeota archaeon]